MQSNQTITVALKLEPDERTKAALIALGWTPPEGATTTCRRCERRIDQLGGAWKDRSNEDPAYCEYANGPHVPR